MTSGPRTAARIVATARFDRVWVVPGCSSSASTPAHPSDVSSGTTSAPLLSLVPFISQV
jgi:hypothetical protein